MGNLKLEQLQADRQQRYPRAQNDDRLSAGSFYDTTTNRADFDRKQVSFLDLNNFFNILFIGQSPNAIQSSRRLTIDFFWTISSFVY